MKKYIAALLLLLVCAHAQAQQLVIPKPVKPAYGETITFLPPDTQIMAGIDQKLNEMAQVYAPADRQQYLNIMRKYFTLPVIKNVQQKTFLSVFTPAERNAIEKNPKLMDAPAMQAKYKKATNIAYASALQVLIPAQAEVFQAGIYPVQQ